MSPKMVDQKDQAHEESSSSSSSSGSSSDSSSSSSSSSSDSPEKVPNGDLEIETGLVQEGVNEDLSDVNS